MTSPTTIKARKALITSWKAEHGCKICGEKDVVVLDLHHPKGVIKNPRLMLNRATRSFYWLSWNDLQKELSICEVLCANCHRRSHKNEGYRR